MGPSFLVLQQPAHHGGEEVRNLGRNAGGSLQPVHRGEERAKDVAHGIDQEQGFFGSQRHPVSLLAGRESKIITAWPPRDTRTGAAIHCSKHPWSDGRRDVTIRPGVMLLSTRTSALTPRHHRLIAVSREVRVRGWGNWSEKRLFVFVFSMGQTCPSGRITFRTVSAVFHR